MDELQNVGPYMDEGDIQGGGIDHAAIELLMNFVNFLWDEWYMRPQVMRLSGGGVKRTITQAITNTIGLKGFDWMARHFMTKRYREAVQQAHNAQTRKRVADYQAGTWAAERLRRRRSYPPRTEDNVNNNSMPVGTGMFGGPRVQAWYDRVLNSEREWYRMKKKAFKIDRTIRAVSAMDVYYTIHKYTAIPFFNVVNPSGTNYYWKNTVGTMNGLWMQRKLTRGTGTIGTSGWTPDLRYGEMETPNDGGGIIAGGYNACSNPTNANILFFTADWPFAQMHWLAGSDNTGDTPSLALWKDVAADLTQTTDPIYPVQFAQIAANKDWTTIYHLGTQITMDFVNYSLEDQNVEVLIFRFIADPDTYSKYSDLATVGMSGYRDWNEYLDGERRIGTPQIEVIRKSRFMLKGSKDINIYKESTSKSTTDMAWLTTVGEMASNRKKKVYNIRRKYAMKRPVEETAFATSFSERGMYNELYLLEKGIFCRVMAWPAKIPFDFYTYDYTSDNPVATLLYSPIANEMAKMPSNVNSNGKPRACVAVQLIKKSFIKLDKPMLRGPFLTNNA